MREGYLRTAAFAALAGVNKKTLHYYDEIGLFHPACVNDKGYRFYSPFQLDRLALIITLRDLGVPLQVIREYLGEGNLNRLDEILTRQREELDRRMAQLEARRALLASMQATNRDFLAWCDRGTQRLYREEERIAVLMTGEEMDKGRNIIVNYLTDGPSTGMCVEGRSRFLYQKQKDGPIVFPAGDYLCLYETAAGPVCWEWLDSRRSQLRQAAADRGWQLEDRALVEFDDLSAAQEAPRSIRMRICEESSSENDRRSKNVS